MGKYILFLPLLFAMLAAPALASTTGAPSLHAFTPPLGDVSVDFLHRVFGTAADGIGVGGMGTVLGAVMSVFCTAVLFLSMIFVAYITIKGTIDSAHSGQLLGQKMSSVWTPVRTVTGSAFLLPLASGYSLIQIGVLWLAVQGVGVADLGWTAAMNLFSMTGSLGQISVPDARPLAADILRSEVCADVMNTQWQADGSPDRIKLVQPDPLPPQNSIYYSTQIQNMSDFNFSQEYQWVDTAAPAGPAACGALSWSQNPQDSETSDITSAPRTAILQAQANAVAAMIQELEPAAKQIAAFKRPAPGVIERAALHYSQAISTAAKNVLDASPDAAKQAFIQHAKDGGWILAGTWYNQMLRLNDTVQANADRIPIRQPIQITSTESQTALASYHDAMALLDSYALDHSAAPQAAYEEAMQSSGSIRSSDDLWRLLSVPCMTALHNITTAIGGANTSPLMSLRSVGEDIIAAGFAIKTAMFVFAGFAGSRFSSLTLGNAFSLSDALKTTSGSVEFLAAGLWAMGAMLAFYLPAIPAILWVGGVIRWLAGVAEAVLAAPLMAAFLIPEGSDESVGRSGAGMMLILGMVMQPILLVCGFLMSALMTYPAGMLVNDVFMGMVSGATDGTVVGPISLLAWVAIYVLMMVTAMHSCFSLVNALPDAVMRYIGAQAGAQNIAVPQAQEAAGRLDSSASGGGAAAARGSMGGSMSGGGTPGGGAGRAEANGISNASPTNADLMGGGS
jgi:conjugal transfer/type IV secretion protein DotA/TraY